jgi:hypothetical protein
MTRVGCGAAVLPAGRRTDARGAPAWLRDGSLLVACGGFGLLTLDLAWQMVAVRDDRPGALAEMANAVAVATCEVIRERGGRLSST